MTGPCPNPRSRAGGSSKPRTAHALTPSMEVYLSRWDPAFVITLTGCHVADLMNCWLRYNHPRWLRRP